VLVSTAEILRFVQDDNSTRLSLISSRGPLDICHPEGRQAAGRISTDSTGQPLQSSALVSTAEILRFAQDDNNNRLM
jgi:hypothetical protein